LNVKEVFNENNVKENKKKYFSRNGLPVIIEIIFFFLSIFGLNLSHFSGVGAIENDVDVSGLSKAEKTLNKD
jgi:hypothetical protein